MLGIRTRRPPPFGGVHITDDKDIQVHRPEEASRSTLWAEGRLLMRDLIFALMIAALVVVFIVQPVKVEGTSMLPQAPRRRADLCQQVDLLRRVSLGAKD